MLFLFCFFLSNYVERIMFSAKWLYAIFSSKERKLILIRKTIKMNANAIFEQVARKHGKTRDEVYADIQEAIDAAYADPDPVAQAEWKKMNIKGERPTPEEVLEYLVHKLKNERGH